ncbi:homoserine kinase [Dimargaris cristalligena]|uniref:Homoserine kinase n=1 Tax=Dimargaris cristalligena TaxID=215637 RepID=A0A4Q0A0Z2_9FUNG|nr:homoserine kinase [Dimargaris cristalligena]|eukprot:RKP39111.1 homoserine kinase [Dimargaris cristalligena]
MTIDSVPDTTFEIKVPATSANIGPGFDSLGLAFSLYLSLHNPTLCAVFDRSVTLEYTDPQNNQGLPLRPSQNLITKTAWYVLRCHGYLAFPRFVAITVTNPIPLSRGLGSSGAAVVAGVLLANEVAGLNLPKDRLLDFALAIERHPDNVSAALLGGFVASYLRDDDTASNTKALEGPFQPNDKINSHTDAFAPSAVAPRMPPSQVSRHVSLPWSAGIRAITVIPQFQLSTAKARAVLPQTYSRADLVYNLQRLAVLTHALGQSSPDAKLIHEAMSDRSHQPYRADLVPGLQVLLTTMVPDTTPGLLGACLSGAGPTVLILANDHFEAIAQKACTIFAEYNVATKSLILDVIQDGSTCKPCSATQ